METKKHEESDEDILKSLGQHTLDVIAEKGTAMDEEIVQKIAELDDLIRVGYSSDGLVSAKIDGTYQVLAITIDPTFTDWSKNQAKTCALVAEAINDAIYNVDLAIETEITTIQYKYTADVITQELKPREIKESFKKKISDVKSK